MERLANESPLWPGQAPGEQPGNLDSRPTLTPYLPPAGNAPAAAVIVCPGGGYGALADHEGAPVAEWLVRLGVAAFVLRYRVSPFRHPIPLGDARRALRHVRANADQYRVDPGRVGILGFSAGGHLAASASTLFEEGDPASEDPVERVSSRPDATVLVYPVISLKDHCHGGSRKNLLGEQPSDADLELLSPNLQVTGRTPPAFLIHSAPDEPVPYQNSALYAQALENNGVPFELHILAHGHHGFGTKTEDPALLIWMDLAANWLRHVGFAPEA